MHDKHAALVSLGKHLGLFVEQVQVRARYAISDKPMTAEEADELKKKTVALAKEWGPHLDGLDPKGEKTRPLINT